MNHLEIPRSNASTPSMIYFDDDFARFATLVGDRQCVVVTNKTLLELYGRTLRQLSAVRVVVIEEGERHKTMTTVEEIHRELLHLGADRSLLLVGFGGGIVTDVTGFAAATYMRGVRVGFIATSLLAQVDASVGGKNGVNLDGFKNIIGTFYQPDWVICPRNVLTTLPARELAAGKSEIIKAGLLRDASLFEMFLSDNVDLTQAVRRSVEIKAEIVAQDEREGGVRKLLNLGHTFAHAVEKCSSGRYLHGEAVAIGLMLAARASVFHVGLNTEVIEKLRMVLEKAGLPISCPEISPRDLAHAMLSDKKKHGDTIDLILLRGIAVPEIFPFPTSRLEELF